MQEHDVSALKDNLYTLDLQLWREALQWLMDADVPLWESYDDMSILGIFAHMRETLFGFLLRCSYVHDEERAAGVDLSIAALKKIYIVDVLNISEWYVPVWLELIDVLLERHSSLFQLWQ